MKQTATKNRPPRPEDGISQRCATSVRDSGDRSTECGNQAAQRKASSGGLPDTLRAGLEGLSGMDLSDVEVHRNSSRPKQLQALAYTEGSDIYVGPGQERHLPHEGWHAVQQKQGRVTATGSIAGKPLNDDPGLESEADSMGRQAAQMKAQSWPGGKSAAGHDEPSDHQDYSNQELLQRMVAPCGNSAAPIQRMKDLPADYYVEVLTDRGKWYGQIVGAVGDQYDVRVGGTSRITRVPENVVSPHPVALALGLTPDAWKGRKYQRMTRESVESNWENVSEEARQRWDKAFLEQYFPYFTMDDQSLVKYKGERELNRRIRELVREKNKAELVKLFTGNFEMTEAEADQAATSSIDSGAPETDQDLYDLETTFKVGWKGSVFENALRRDKKEKHGEYTGKVNLGEGTFVASGSYRSGDALNQNEIIYQIWKTTHEVNELDMTNPAERKPLKQITRHNVVNETLRPLFDEVGEGDFRPGDRDFDRLVSTPNIRAALFLIKDRGKELGIRNISQVTIQHGNAIIDFE